MNEPKTVRFTGAEIILALIPAIKQKLVAEHGVFESGTLEYNIMLTRWEARAIPYTGKSPLPPGMVGMTVDVEFTLERLANLEAT